MTEVGFPTRDQKLDSAECLELKSAPADQRRKVYEKARIRVSCTDDLKLHRKILTGLIELVAETGDTKYIEQLKVELDSLGPVSDSSDAESELHEEATPDISGDIDINDITGQPFTYLLRSRTNVFCRCLK